MICFLLIKKLIRSFGKILADVEAFGLIEIVIVTAIVGATLAGFLQASILSVRLLRVEREMLEATMLAQEGMEAVRLVRDESWTNNIAPLANDTIYYPIIINNKWMISANNPGVFNSRYTRHIVFNQVFRNGTDDIAASGTADSGTRKITITVSWGSKQVQLVSYLTNFQEQLSGLVESKIISYEGAITDVDLISFPSNNVGDGDPGQSFTTLASAPKITRVDALLRRTTSSPSNIYAEIRATPIGVALGTSNLITASTIATSSAAWVEFRFVPEVSLSASTLYYIVLRSIPSSNTVASGSVGSINWLYLQTPSSPYSGGAARRYIGRLSNPADAGQQLDQYDFGFKVYALQ
ncbi:MAG: type II secretion system protein [Patescibacteria group bacterium]